MFHSNANFVLEQRDLADEHFPEAGGRRGRNAVRVPAAAPLPPQEPPTLPAPPAPPKPKPMPEAVEKNAQLAELKSKIGNAQKIMDEQPAANSVSAADKDSPADSREESKQPEQGYDTVNPESMVSGTRLMNNFPVNPQDIEVNVLPPE